MHKNNYIYCFFALSTTHFEASMLCFPQCVSCRVDHDLYPPPPSLTPIDPGGVRSPPPHQAFPTFWGRWFLVNILLRRPRNFVWVGAVPWWLWVWPCLAFRRCVPGEMKLFGEAQFSKKKKGCAKTRLWGSNFFLALCAAKTVAQGEGGPPPRSFNNPPAQWFLHTALEAKPCWSPQPRTARSAAGWWTGRRRAAR